MIMTTSLKQNLSKNSVFRKTFAKPLEWRYQKARAKTQGFYKQYNDVIKGGELLLQIDNLDSSFYIDARSHLAARIIYEGHYEQQHFEAMQRYWRGGSLINIGANVGFWAVGLSKVLPNVEKVVAIEPQPDAFALLQRNIQHNQVQNQVVPVQRLISSKTETVMFESIPGMPEYSSIGGVVHSSVRQYETQSISLQSCPLDTINEVQEQDFSFMLIDVEGAEYLVLEGSQKFIERNRPTVMFECSERLLNKFGHSVNQVREFWQDLDYTITVVDGGDTELNDGFNGDAIAIPKEQN